MNNTQFEVILTKLENIQKDIKYIKRNYIKNNVFYSSICVISILFIIFLVGVNNV